MMEGSFPPSSLSTPTPASSSSPATPSSQPFKPRKSEDWNKYRPFIEQYYRNDQLKLKDVKLNMERHHNFYASEKQYKDRLHSWNVRKNIKNKEVKVMYRKQQKRAAIGKQTVFRVAGQKVDSKRIARFVRRYGPNFDTEPRSAEVSRDGEESPEPYMSYYTPEPDERPTSLSLSPHPENPPHPYDSLNTIPDFGDDDDGPIRAVDPKELKDPDGLPLKPIPPIAKDPHTAYARYNEYIMALGTRLEEDTKGWRPSSEDHTQSTF
ncbi:Clr5 domain-containing protein [Aspergillus multicolor]|uniref:Clr5 domain-containing protein n=1 Tax=Aspergillus multicolor TaxID=41759 RepID=UPI003CCDCE14